MKSQELEGLRIWLGQPVQITAQLGWEESWGGTSYQPTWCFIHLTPWLARFPGGELIATYTLDPDNLATPIRVSGFQISKDGGGHWGRRYSELMQHNPMVFIPKPDDSLLAIPSELMEEPTGDERNFCGPAYLFEHGGDEMVLKVDAVRLLGWPFPHPPHDGPLPRETWAAGPTITGDCVQLGARLLIPAECRKAEFGGILESEVMLASEDGGYTWRYWSTIDDPDPSRAGQPGYEGPNEGFVLALPDGDLMAVYRGVGLPVGGVADRGRYLTRKYSHDGGRTWSEGDALPAWSVKPALVRTADGVIALSTGRQGIYLWLSRDPRAEKWQSVDIVAHHNAWAKAAWPGDQSFVIGTATLTSPPHPARLAGRKFNQTTSYTGLVEVAPDKLILVYDRDTEGPPATPRDFSRVFALPIEIDRK